MSNRSIPDPVEATFRDLRGAVYTGDGRSAMAAIERSPDRDSLQSAGDGLRLALAQGVTGATARVREHIALLRDRDLGGDEELALELEAMLGLAPAPALRDLPVDLDDRYLALEGDPLLTGGRLDLRTGDVHQIGPLHASDFLNRIDDGEGDSDEGDEADDRWLLLDSPGSRPGFRDLEEFLETVADERLADRLGRALGGRGAFRRFKDELADAPGELARFHRYTDDRRRGRARQWLAESGLRPAVRAEPPAPGRPASHRAP